MRQVAVLHVKRNSCVYLLYYVDACYVYRTLCVIIMKLCRKKLVFDNQAQFSIYVL